MHKPSSFSLHQPTRSAVNTYVPQKERAVNQGVAHQNPGTLISEKKNWNVKDSLYLQPYNESHYPQGAKNYIDWSGVYSK